ncbi:hypothetical protein ILUMI_09061 [Ignelater luminosus]|uniref:YTH domain-containing protein n=1 Tax=Ignelater luminosus TaxID=2038154 RepID=A0A8K0DA14_IGNLU|nr:hypothetical protein ILUMI_09061 [Ignelater luminosus]
MGNSSKDNQYLEDSSKVNHYLEEHQEQLKSPEKTFTISDLQHSLQQVQLMYKKDDINNRHICDVNNSQTEAQHTAQDRLLNAISTTSSTNYNGMINEVKSDVYEVLTNSQFLSIAHQRVFHSTNNTVFFVIKPSSSNYILQNNLECTLTLAQNILGHLMKNDCVFLFFAIPFKNILQGVAQVMNILYCTSQTDIRWLSQGILPYERISSRNLANPWEFENGQKLENTIGRQLYSMFFEC